MGPNGIAIRPYAKLVRGRWFSPGQREVAVSRSIAGHFMHADAGDLPDFGKGAWKVTGVFEAGGTASNSEIRGDFNEVASQFNRQNSIGSMYLRATNATDADALKERVSNDQRLGLQGMLETEYYARQTSSDQPIRLVGYFVSLILAIGSTFAATNAMYASVSYRAREIATLRVLGFSRNSILASFIFESVLLALFGAVIGIVLMLPFNGMTTTTENQVSYR
jgi:putative ABC transport system permease protein